MAIGIFANETLVKQPDEDKLYSCDFTNLLTGSAVLTGTPVVTGTPTGLTIAAPALDATTKKVEVRISSGTDLVTYNVQFTAADDASNTHVVDCTLMVRH